MPRKPAKAPSPDFAAVVNAVYDVIGVRLRNLPLTPDVVAAGIGSVKSGWAEDAEARTTSIGARAA